MLKRFEVENFKNFKNKLVLDLAKPYNYEFNNEIIKSGIVTKGIVYGPNAAGKTNLGLAVLDIVTHLTDAMVLQRQYTIYANLDSKKNEVKFSYDFQFGEDSFKYEYGKKSVSELTYETVWINKEEVFNYNYVSNEGYSYFKGTETMNLTGTSDNKVSRLKYILNTAVLEDDFNNAVLQRFKNFVDGMLLFYSLDERGYQGFKSGAGSVSKMILEKGKLKEFELFLREHGINYKLTEEMIDGEKTIQCVFPKGKISFFSIASTGTKSLALFYYWSLYMKDLSLVFIDEFDAFYHFELAKALVDLLRKIPNTQIILTTHNTDLMSNDLLRPDCYFQIANGTIKCLADSTEKELRRAHNLQKMYKAGAFNE